MGSLPMPLLQQGEPIRDAAVAKYAAAASDGKTYQAEFYNLDGIIRWLPGQNQTGHTISYMSNRHSERIYAQGICAG